METTRVDDEEDEELEEESSDREFGNETLPCPVCGSYVYDDSPRCPSCGNYISDENGPWTRQPWWWVTLGAAGIAAVIWVMTGI